MNIEIPQDLDLSGLNNAEVVARLQAGMDVFEQRAACTSGRAAVIVPVEPETLASLERLARMHQMSLTGYLSDLMGRQVERWGRYLKDESWGRDGV
jgi:hypothetical protein